MFWRNIKHKDNFTQKSEENSQIFWLHYEKIRKNMLCNMLWQLENIMEKQATGRQGGKTIDNVFS